MPVEDTDRVGLGYAVDLDSQHPVCRRHKARCAKSDEYRIIDGGYAVPGWSAGHDLTGVDQGPG